MSLKRVRRYFFPKPLLIHRVPRQFIDEHYTMTGATHEQILLVRHGAARTPKEAQMLLDHYGVKRAVDCLYRMPKPRKTLLERVLRLLQKIAGESPHVPHHKMYNDKVFVEYRWK